VLRTKHDSTGSTHDRRRVDQSIWIDTYLQLADKGAPGDVRSKLRKLLTNVKPTTVESPAIFDGTIPLSFVLLIYFRLSN